MSLEKFKIIYFLLAVILLNSSCTNEKVNNVVKIGHVAPLTGNEAHLGKDNEAAFKLAIKDLNSQKIVINGQELVFKGISEDDAADPKQGASAAQKLIDLEVIGVIGHLNSGTTVPASIMYNRASIPQISPSATLPKYTRQGFKYAFRVVANDVQLGGSLGTYSYEVLNGKTAAIIDDRSAYGAGVATEFKSSFINSGGKIISTQYTNNKATDFFAILTAIKAKKPDLIFFGGMDAVAGQMLRQIKQLKISSKLIGGDGICTGKLPLLAGDSIGKNLVFCATAGGQQSQKFVDSNKKFLSRFESETGNPVVLYAPYVYDATMILAEAIRITNSLDPLVFAEKIKSLRYEGVTGPISFDEFGDVKEPTLTIFTFDGQEKKVVEIIKS